MGLQRGAARCPESLSARLGYGRGWRARGGVGPPPLLPPLPALSLVAALSLTRLFAAGCLRLHAPGAASPMGVALGVRGGRAAATARPSAFAPPFSRLPLGDGASPRVPSSPRLNYSASSHGGGGGGGGAEGPSCASLPLPLGVSSSGWRGASIARACLAFTPRPSATGSGGGGGGGGAGGASAPPPPLRPGRARRFARGFFSFFYPYSKPHTQPHTS